MNLVAGSSIFLATLVLVLASNLSHAGNSYYRWIDTGGNTVISDRPPTNGTEFETISTGASLVHPQETEAVEPDSDQLPEKPEWRQPKEVVKTAAVQKDPGKCQQAKDIIWTLDSYARIRAEDDNGEYRYIDEDEQAVRRKEANEAIKTFCE